MREPGTAVLARLHRPSAHRQPTRRPSAPPVRADYSDALLKILASPNVASKEWIIRQYDHEVQGGSGIK
ncbi:MAG TPA: hypothetical protein PK408_08900, partial [Treponemataceae bacterium]|nr:hypothetical protein [Treponemataceae bacterium]